MFKTLKIFKLQRMTIFFKETTYLDISSHQGKNDRMVQMGFSRRLHELNNVFVRLLCDFKLHKYATNRKIWQVNLFKREKIHFFCLLCSVLLQFFLIAGCIRMHFDGGGVYNENGDWKGLKKFRIHRNKRGKNGMLQLNMNSFNLTPCNYIKKNGQTFVGLWNSFLCRLWVMSTMGCFHVWIHSVVVR